MLPRKRLKRDIQRTSKQVLITPEIGRCIDMILLGKDIVQISDNTGIPVVRLENAINSPEGREYIQKASNLLASEIPVEKRKLILELYRRLHEASNKDAIAIVAQISKMLDFEEKNDASITIVFAEDPFALEKTEVIDVEYEEQDDG